MLHLEAKIGKIVRLWPRKLFSNEQERQDFCWHWPSQQEQARPTFVRPAPWKRVPMRGATLRSNCRWLLVPIIILSLLQLRSVHQTATPVYRNRAALLAKLSIGDVATADNSLPSVLVPLAAIPDTDKPLLPGIFRYGRNDTQLFITGASITSEYNSHKTLWFQFFALGQRVFDKDKAPNYGEPCRAKDANSTSDTDGVPTLKEWDEMREETFLCRVGTRTARFEMVPSEGFDPNTNQVLHIWRCPLHGVPGQEPLLSGSDVQRILQSPEVVALPIEIMYKDVQWSRLTAVAKLHLSSNDPNLGLNRAKLSDPQRPFFQQRHNITLCMTSLANGLVTMNEFIRYHVDVVGLDHIHLGLEARYNNKDDARIVRIVKSLLRPEIEAGRLTVSTLWEEDSLGICDNTGILKQIFYQTCLYRGKTTSEFVATWDIDEYFMFLENAREQRLPDFLRGIKHPECQDWSYVTMKSAFAAGDLPENNRYRTGLAALDYPIRENVTNDVWQKSISRTKNVYLNSFHIPGSSMPEEGKSNASDAIAISPGAGKCAFYLDEAIVIHVRGLPARRSERIDGHTVPNELQSLLMSGSGA